jgi:hypothetical protein
MYAWVEDVRSGCTVLVMYSVTKNANHKFVHSLKGLVLDTRNERMVDITLSVRATILGSGHLLIPVRPAVLLLWSVHAVGCPMGRDAFLRHGHVRPVHAPWHPPDVYPMHDYRRGGCAADINCNLVAVERSSAVLLSLAFVHDSE